MTEYTDYKHLKYVVQIDEGNHGSPRDWDNVSIMAFFHNRHNLGDEINFNTTDFENWDKMETYIREDLHGINIHPVYMYDHSSHTFSMDTIPPCPGSHIGYDTGCIGFIYTTQKQLDLMGTPNEPEKLNKIFKSELAEYEAWINGWVYQRKIYTQDEEVLDSCGGYYGQDGKEYAKKEAKLFIDSLSKQAKERQIVQAIPSAYQWTCPECGTPNDTDKSKIRRVQTCPVCGQEVELHIDYQLALLK